MKIWKIESEDQFYDIIVKCDRQKLKKILDNKEKYYGKPISIPKKNGLRLIYGINKKHDLYKIQKRTLDNFLINIKVSDRACGFIKGTSYYEFLEPHKDFYKKNYYLRMDLENFFGSISKEKVRNCLSYYVSDNIEKRDELLDTITDIVTYNDEIIQGAITSPTISNIIFRDIDIRIQKYCFKYDTVYTRYADDLLFSGHNDVLHKKSFCKGIEKIVGSKEFRINYSKTKRVKGYISLNGFVVDDNIRISRKKLEGINRVIFFLGKKSELQKVKGGDLTALNSHIKKETNIAEDRFKGKYELINYLNGYRAFVISAIKNTENTEFIEKSKKIIAKIESIVDEISH